MCALYVYLYMVLYEHLLIYSNIHKNIYIVKEVIKDIINFKNENNSEMVFVIYFNFVLWKFCGMYFEHIHDQLLPFSSSSYHFFTLNFETTSLCLVFFCCCCSPSNSICPIQMVSVLRSALVCGLTFCNGNL